MHLFETMVPGEWRVGGVAVSPEWHVPLKVPAPKSMAVVNSAGTAMTGAFVHVAPIWRPADTGF